MGLPGDVGETGLEGNLQWSKTLLCLFRNNQEIFIQSIISFLGSKGVIGRPGIIGLTGEKGCKLFY